MTWKRGWRGEVALDITAIAVVTAPALKGFDPCLGLPAACSMTPSAEELITIADKRAVTSAAGAALSWLIWDVIIHFDVEVECIWKRPNSWAKFAYFFLRYITIFHEGAVLTINGSARFSNTGCRGWLIHELVYMEVLTFVVEVNLVIRLYVLYNHNRVVLAAMLALFAAEIVMMIAVLGIELGRINFFPDCLVASAPSFFMAYWLSSLAFETFLFALTLIVFFRVVRREYGKSSIIHVFVRDGTWAFALIFVTLLLNLLMYRLNTNPLAGMGYYWGLSVMSFAGSHVLLNIRRLGVPNYLSVATLPTIQFGDRPAANGTTGFFSTAQSSSLPAAEGSDVTESTAVASGSSFVDSDGILETTPRGLGGTSAHRTNCTAPDSKSV